MNKITVNPDISFKQTKAFGKKFDEIRRREISGEVVMPESNQLIVKAALETGILLGASPEEINDEMKTGRIVALGTMAAKAFAAELKPIDDPN
ncbi:MAG: hypothetical protein C0391_03925 [Anaerolinea sp.]|nr:hypothetical protein [Anaerolinea sp.]